MIQISKPEFFVFFFPKRFPFPNHQGTNRGDYFPLHFPLCIFSRCNFSPNLLGAHPKLSDFQGTFFPKHRLESMLNFPCVYLRDSGSENFSDSRWANIFCTTSLTPLLTRYFRNPSTQGPKLCPLKKVLLKMMFLLPR